MKISTRRTYDSGVQYWRRNDLFHRSDRDRNGLLLPAIVNPQLRFSVDLLYALDGKPVMRDGGPKWE